jgi:HEAT repeat protein
LTSTQVSFEAAINDLASPDAGTRLRAVQLLKPVAYPEAAVPLAALVMDPQDDVQLAAIAAEVNIFLAEPVVTKKRVALVVEVRNAVQAEAAFSAGPYALGSRPVPAEVLTALRTAARDQNPRVAIEALYAFGVVAVSRASRAAGPAACRRPRHYGVHRLVGSGHAGTRRSASWDRCSRDGRRTSRSSRPSATRLITALNDNDRAVKAEAMSALAMRYDRGVQALTDLFGYYAKGPR